MKEEIKYAGWVDEAGKLKVSQQKTFKLDILSKFTGKDVWVTVEERQEKASRSQRGYLFGVIIKRIQQALRREQGLVFTPSETKHWIEETFLVESRTNENTGEIYDVAKSIGDLRKQELTELIDLLIMTAAQELNEIIPFPDERED